MVKFLGVNPPLAPPPPRRGTQSERVRSRKNHFDERSYGDWKIFLCPIKLI
ncbi:hypothetical protein [Okeania sp. SIO1I7]|uniref:hypothetical protein n=1 Tax=Okeania sp. SIO1I7 TaxID=2607772 RepID=UPI0013FAD446|nr:hypothetical protein [Okeania sp. SIO1I7]NET27967.1 hypothetical protein [Okeania sp. SIO1I7]